jgi:RNA polymerase sigma factor (sigma-70 family)
MATNQLRRVLQALRGAALPHEEAALADGQLLERYLRGREEAAFAALVQRHGPMVWGVCRRLLRSHHDAEDAFQATFLVLVRKAASVVPRDLVGNWLYGVAHQTALKARATAAKRGTREKQVTAMPEPGLNQPAPWDDLQPLLDQELSRLPAKYRAVIVLCDLQGKTRKEAARHFRLPEGTVATRLATARTMLAKRLGRLGLAFSGASLAALLAQQGASAGVPVAVVSSTIKAASHFAAGQGAAPGVLSVKAVALAEGVLKTMLLTKLKMATAVLLAVAVLGTAAAALTYRVPADQPADPPAAEKTQPADQPVAEKKGGDKEGVVVSGVVKAVDVEKNTLTVSQRAGEKTITVASDAPVVINGRPGNLAGLQKGALASLSLSEDTRTALSVEAIGPQVGGAVTAIDAEKRTLTVTLSHGGGEKTFSLTKNATVVIDGKPGQLAALPPGANVTLSWFADQKTARNLEAVGPWWQSVLVKAVDAGKMILTIDEAQREVELAGKTLSVAKDANIRIDGQPGKLAGLPPGASITLQLCVDQKTAKDVEAVRQAQAEYAGLKARAQRLGIACGRAALDVAAAVTKVVDGKHGFTARAAYDGQNFYVTYDVESPFELVNSIPEPQILFKGGNVLDIQLATDPSADPKRTRPASGDVRLLVTRQQGKPVAVVYRPKVKEFTGQPVLLKSPTGQEGFDAIEVSDKVRLDYRKTPAGFSALVTVTLAVLGWTPQPNSPVRLDLGYLFGNATGNQCAKRAYWANTGPTAGIIGDVPSESRLEPHQWGTATVE